MSTRGNAAALDGFARAHAAAEATHGFWLVDPALGDPADDVFKRWPEANLNAITLSHADVTSTMRPYLIGLSVDASAREAFALAGAEYAHRESTATVSGARPRSLCAFIASDLNGAALAAKLAEAALIKMTAGPRRILRFWDPRVLARLVADPALHRFLPREAPGQWLYFDALGRLCRTDTATWGENAGEQQRPSERQIEALSRIGEWNRVLETLRENTKAGDLAAASVHIAAALDAATVAGLTRAADRVAFAAARVAHEAPIEYAARITELITATQGGLPYAALQKEIDPLAWSDIVRDAREEYAARHEASQNTGVNRR